MKRLHWIAVLHGVLLAVATSCQAREPQTGDRVSRPISSELFRHQYTIYNRDFCGAQVCVDFDHDGQVELMYASRDTGELQQLDASDGTVKWSRRLKGNQQSVMAYDLEGDGLFEILYSVSDPGVLYLLDGQGNVINSYDSGDKKLGNSAVVLDADNDGELDALFGSRQQYLIRLGLRDFTHVQRRTDWVQCGCYTSALDVDHDGHWDLFAGRGDDHSAKGVLHRYDPVTLKSLWSFSTNDNASSADAVLVDLDGDGRVEVVKSVDNYNRDDAHDAVYALTTDGTVLWKVSGISGEDSPNVADLDGDGSVEIVGMTFGGEVYLLKSDGQVRWRKDLRPKLDDGQHMYMAPILCDLNGDAELEILAMTNGQYSSTSGVKPSAMLFALNVQGDILDTFDLGESRFWGHAFVCNLDNDPWLEIVVSGSGGLDVIETRGYGPNTQHFQRRRSYQRLNVVPWAYEDHYFIEGGTRDNVSHLADHLVLSQDLGAFRPRGTFTTKQMTLPPGCVFSELRYRREQPAETDLVVNVLGQSGQVLASNVKTGDRLDIAEPVRLQFVLSTSNTRITPKLDWYSMGFRRLSNP